MIGQRKVAGVRRHNPCGKLNGGPRASGFVKFAGQNCLQIPVFGAAELHDG
jgi:hypothetical protein